MNVFSDANIKKAMIEDIIKHVNVPHIAKWMDGPVDEHEGWDNATTFVLTPDHRVISLGSMSVPYNTCCTLNELDELDLVQIKLYMIPLQKCVDEKGFVINQSLELFLGRTPKAA